ncbi:MAG TPA: metallophosphoesterase [Nocardioides sp.]|uniref:metallophosphoesterase n=1 Tax=Nocardioides sp. TaxID=35761 RepID=UPI002B659B05|nr:metallophosphoesterase [Nocardioides sp.]HTW17422.1 metallophosphoesterase [Nocardioides sp.]
MTATVKKPSLRPLALVAAAGLAGSLLGAVSPAAAATVPGLTGTGTAADPVVIASAADLTAAAEAVNAQPGTYAGLSYRVDADINYQGATFPTFHTFTGQFDGNGHAISNIGGYATSVSTGFFRSATDATISDLTLVGVNVTVAGDPPTAGHFAAALVETGNNVTVRGNSLIDSKVELLKASITATNSRASGLVNRVSGASVIADNYLDDVDVIGKKYPSAVVNWVSAGSPVVERNLVVDTRVNEDTQGAGSSAAYVVLDPNATTTIRDNVVKSGWIYMDANTGSGRTFGTGWITADKDGTATGNLVNANNNRNFDAEGHVEQTVKTRGTGTYDLAWDSDIDLTSVPSETGATGTTWRIGHDGSPASPAELARQATYEGIGWDFAAGSGTWRWEPVMGNPVPRNAQVPPLKRAGVAGSGTTADPYLIGSVGDLEAMRAAVASDHGVYGADTFRLVADIDFAGAEFTGLDRFSGTLDGNGHTIANPTYAASDGSADLGLVRELDGTIRGLTLAGVRLAPEAGTERVSAVAVSAGGTETRPATITQVEVDDAVLSAPAAARGAGLVAEAGAHTSVHDNDVEVAVTVADLAAGLAATVEGDAAVRNNLVREDSSVAAPRAEKVVGRDLGPATTVRGNVVVGDDADGLDEHAKSTYSALGWDFVDAWMWDLATLLPRIKYVAPEEMPNRITATFHGDPGTRRAFTWYQDLADAVEPGAIVSTDPRFPDDATRIFEAQAEESNEGESLYRVVATDLTPGLTYYYRVGDTFTGKWSETGTFETADGGDDFSFIGLTDTQARGGATEAAVSANTLDQALRTVPDSEFMIHAGDVVQTSEEELDWVDLFDKSQASLLANTIAPVAGNHDGAPDEFTDHFTLEAPDGQNTSAGVYYSYDYNDAHFVMLNTNEGRGRCQLHGFGNDTDCDVLSDEQVAWLRADVAAAREAGAKWIVLTMHKGVYTAGAHPFDAEILRLRDKLVPIIDELDIDLVIQGHDHYWTRTKELFSDPSSPVKARAAAPASEVIEEVIGGVRVEYKVDPEGTLFVTPGTAGAKHYSQLEDGIAEGISEDDYLGLFERLGGGLSFSSNSHPSFLEIDVADDRLTVNRHEVDGNGRAYFAEGFGIDRETSQVDALLAALPAAADVTLADEPAVRAARVAVRTLTEAQRGALGHLDRLRAAEAALRVLHGVASSDGSEVAWADAGATERQPVTVSNDQRRTLTDVPVRLQIEDTPDVEADTFALYTDRSVPVPFEVETWQPGGTSVVWARLDQLTKLDSQVVWAYFGGLGAPDNDPRDVWGEDFELVEHFATDLAVGDALTDSTGKVTGTLVGSELTAVTDSESALPGSGSVRFDSSRLQYDGNVGASAKKFTVSGIFALTPGDIAAIGGERNALVARSVPGAEEPTMELGLRKADGLFQALTPFDDATTAIPTDAEPHVVTVTFDEMTYAVFVDGVEAHSAMAEGRRFPNLFDAPLTVGDSGVDPDDPNRLLEPFLGVVDELWIATMPFIPELDAFRADNYFGDAVRLGKRETRSADELVLALGRPGDGADVEAGRVDVFGSVSKRSVLTAEIGGETVFEQQVEAGVFTVPVPVLTTGSGVEVTFTATTTAEPSLVSEPAVLRLDVSDTTAPRTPLTTVQRPANDSLRLQVTPQTDLPETVEAQYYANESVPLGSENVQVRTGATADREPGALTPLSGTPTGELTPATVGDDENPFQIYRFTLTEEQAAEDEWHFSWRGKADKRTVSAWVWDTEAQKWQLKEDDASPEGADVNLDVRTTAAEHPVSDGRVLTVLVWRGLTALPWAESEDFDDVLPSADDYDWSFNHVGDTQLYSQATPWTMTEQFEYIADKAAERKTAMVVQAGDWVNKEEFEDEWQWRNAEPSAQALEEADIPLAVSWGNHDYNESYNGRQMLKKYFPMERFEEGLEGSPWSFGGHLDIDNYFYTGEISGSKILWLQMGHWSVEPGMKNTPAGIAWAQSVIESHPDHSVILSTHHHLWARDANNPYSNPTINELIDPYPNVKLVLSGHQSGTFVTSRTNSGGSRVVAILTDYQTRAWGGHGFLKNLSVDAENNLIYVNTYSPWLQRTTSDGRWSQEIPKPSTPGYWGENSENYVIEVDLGGAQQRTLETSRVTFASGAPEALGEPVTLVGDEQGEVTFHPDLDVTQEWYAVLTDGAGNSVTSKTNIVRRVASFAIGYDLAGGRAPETENPTTYTSEDAVTLAAPTRTGYTFLGWTGAGVTSPTATVTIPAGSTGDRSYTAHWRVTPYRLGYDLAGGYLTRANPTEYTIETGALSLSNPRRSGFDFAGWTGTDLSGPTTEVTVPAGSVGARSYVATWTPRGFPITYDLAGGTASGNPASYTVESAAFTLANPTRPGHRFTGWVGTGLSGASTSVTVATGTSGALTFRATWQPLAKVKPSVRAKVTRTRGRASAVIVTVPPASGRTAATGTVVVKLTGTVTKRVKGKARRVSVTRTVRGTLTAGTARIALPKRLPAGRWRAVVTYRGDASYLSARAKVVRFRL